LRLCGLMQVATRSPLGDCAPTAPAQVTDPYRCRGAHQGAAPRGHRTLHQARPVRTVSGGSSSNAPPGRSESAPTSSASISTAVPSSARSAPCRPSSTTNGLKVAIAASTSSLATAPRPTPADLATPTVSQEVSASIAYRPSSLDRTNKSRGGAVADSHVTGLDLRLTPCGMRTDDDRVRPARDQSSRP
jgi:hypothetical protein